MGEAEGHGMPGRPGAAQQTLKRLRRAFLQGPLSAEKSDEAGPQKPLRSSRV